MRIRLPDENGRMRTIILSDDTRKIGAVEASNGLVKQYAYRPWYLGNGINWTYVNQ